MPTTGKASFDDMLTVMSRWTATRSMTTFSIETDGLPTLTTSLTRDDHLMAISHVMRGTAHLSSAPKYNLL